MSITLTTPYSVSINGTQVESDTAGACVSSSVDYLGKIMTYTYKVGTFTASPPTFNVGPYSQNPPSQNIVVSVYVGSTTGNQTFGQWWLNGNLQPTIIATASLTASTAQLLSNRNTAENFASVSGGLMPGTQVPWTAL